MSIHVSAENAHFESDTARESFLQVGRAHAINIAPMKNPGEQFNQKWREANERVRAAEDELHQAWNAYAAGKAPAPPMALMDKVTRLRREGDAELSKLLANLQIGRDRPADDGSGHPR